MIAAAKPTTKLYEKSYLVIEYDAEKKLLIQNWRGFATSAEFREGIEKSVEIFRQKKPSRLLSNTQNSSLVKKEDTEWAATYGIGNMLQNGLKAVAFIISTNAFTQMSVSNFKDQTKNAPFVMQYFDDVEKATNWLLTVQ
ncbi:hypothetical protein [Cesiribacter sp. SM1]|uniref:hypothetical protein n=1 Tax=Cesiribacter sp. SM1 TaxID=2861196 RepID=UPI001CD3739E|nr:hypothetical protein [Cesiribacter sp. SM1]